MKPTFVAFILSFLFVFLFACLDYEGVYELTSYTHGVIQYIPLEGGFYAIRTNDSLFIPMHLPEEFKKNGLHILFKYELLNNSTSIFMYGKPIKLLDIEYG